MWVLSHLRPTLELWEFAAHYSFEEMEKYCRTVLSEEIDSIIGDPSKGIQYLILDRGLPLLFVSQLVSDFAARMQHQRQHVRWLRHCMDESDIVRSGRSDDHVNEYLKDVKLGCFSYVGTLKESDCRVCRRYNDMWGS